MSDPGRPHVIVIGGGIAGLAAAFFLREVPCRVTVLEGSPRLGGKLSVSEIAGVVVDDGAEALLARRPEGTGLVAAVGLEGQQAWPGTTAARIWSRGRMCPLPRRQVLGVPADLAELAETGLISSDGMARARQDLGLPATTRDGDVPVAAFVAARFGQGGVLARLGRDGGQGGLERQFLRPAGIDPSEERIHQAIHHLVAEPRRHEGGHRHITVPSGGRQAEILPRPGHAVA